MRAVVVVLPDPFRGMGREGTPQRPNSRATPQGLDQKSKMEVVPRWRAGEAQLQDNPGGGESVPADGVRRRCKKNSPSVLSCKGKRTREGCDRGSEVGTVHSE